MFFESKNVAFCVQTLCQIGLVFTIYSQVHSSLLMNFINLSRSHKKKKKKTKP